MIASFGCPFFVVQRPHRPLWPLWGQIKRFERLELALEHRMRVTLEHRERLVPDRFLWQLRAAALRRARPEPN